MAVQMTSDDRKAAKPKLTMKEVVKKGSIIGAIVTVPSLAVFFAVWVVLDDMMIGAVSGVITHFVAMGFSLKISKRLLAGGGETDPPGA